MNTPATIPHTGYRLYWLTWLVLLAFTLAMLLSGFAPWPRWALLTLLVCAMLVKAGFIAWNFMHLRFEHPGLAMIVAGSLLATGALLFLVLASDALHVLRQSAGG